MKKLVFILFVILVSCTLNGCSKKEGYKDTNFSLAKSNEKKLLKSFYKNEEFVSKGKRFDMKYVFYDEKSPGYAMIEIVKKVDDDIVFDELSIYDENNKKLIECGKNEKLIEIGDSEKLSAGFAMDNGGDLSNAIFIFPGDHYFGNIMFDSLFSTYGKENGKTKYFKLGKRIQSIKIVLKYDGNTETHKLKYNQQQMVSELKEIDEIDDSKFDISIRSHYRIKKSYYYVYLISNNFNEWEVKIKEYLKTKSNLDYSWSTMFALPYYEDIEFTEEFLQKYLGLDDKQFEKYLTLHNKAEKTGKFEFPYN